jgi:divalent metal cation (Fe/Co/Zn/Cd) transporter
MRRGEVTDQVTNKLVSRAIAVSALSVAWGVITAVLAIAAAGVTGSPSLAGFALAAAIDSAGSAVLVWYFRAHGRDPDRAEQRERIALRSVGSALIVAAAYVGIRAITQLTRGSAPEVSAVGVVVASASVVILPILAVVKLRLAARIPSAALRADGVLTAGSAVLAAMTLTAVSLRGSDGLWWLDPAIALVIAAALAAEGTRTIAASHPGRVK